MATQSPAKLAALTDSLTLMVQSLRAAGHEVLLVQIPRWAGEDTWVTASRTLNRILADGCAQQMPIERALARQGDVRDAVTAASSATGAPILDLWPTLCPDSMCSTNAPGYPRYYRDGAHVSVTQGRELAPQFASALHR